MTWPFFLTQRIANLMIEQEGGTIVNIAYPDMSADVLAGRELQRERICRTFSDCTTAPRNGIVSGCYPLDDFYKKRPEYDKLQAVKKAES